MSSYISNGINYPQYYQYPQYQQNFRGDGKNAPNIIQKPIEKVENVFNTTLDHFVKPPEDEEKKKSHKKAITVGSTVIVLSALTAILNPRFSGKFVGKMKTLSQKAEINMKKNKDDFIKTKFYSIVQKIGKHGADFAQFTNTINATKDAGFKWLCSADKFNNIKNPTAKKVLKAGNNGFTEVMTKANNTITNWFDDVGKSTVIRSYSNANKKLDMLDEAIKLYKKKLTPEELKLVEEKLKDVNTAKKYFSEKELISRFGTQEKAMENIQADFNDKLINGYLKKFKGYKSAGTFKEKFKYDMQLIGDNMSYWAEDMLMPTRNKLEKQGQDAISKLVGNGKDVKGSYQEIIDIMSPHLKDEEKKILNDALKTSNKTLHKANKRECFEYFDKKRDLMLGGAPTDILTGTFMLGASGIAIGTADNTHDRASRALTMGVPAVAGIGTSIAMTAMLFSGFEGLLIGGITGLVLSKLCSKIDSIINPPPVDSTIKQPTEILDNQIKPQEAQYA